MRLYRQDIKENCNGSTMSTAFCIVPTEPNVSLTHWTPSELHSITTRKQHPSVISVRILGITSQWGYVLPRYLFNFLPSVLFNFPFPFSSHTQTHTHSEYSCSTDQVFWAMYKLPPLSLLPVIQHNYITDTTLMCLVPRC